MAIHFSSEYENDLRIKKRKNKAFLYDQVRYLIEYNTLNSSYIYLEIVEEQSQYK